jgi:UDP-glucose 4-epimerase
VGITQAFHTNSGPPQGLLVLGASGRIGTLLRRHWAIPSDLICQSRQPRAGFLCFDPLKDQRALCDAAADARAILCLAGVVPRETPQTASDFVVNKDLALAAVRAAHLAGCPRVFLASSAAVYGNQPGLLAESTPCDPVSDYGRSKRAMEDAALALGAALGQSVTVLRIGNVAGADMILGGWHRGMCIDQLPSGQTPQRSYIGPQTLCCILQALVDQKDLPEVLNVASRGSVKLGDLLTAAGLPWHPKAARSGVIAQVTLDLRLLSERVPEQMRRTTAQALVDEWRSCIGAEAMAS